MSWIDYWTDAYARDQISLAAFELIAEDAYRYGYATMPKSMVYVPLQEVLGSVPLRDPDEDLL